MKIGYRDVRVFPPFPSEVPHDVVGDGFDLDDVRVAKHDGRVVGAYRLAPAGSVFRILSLVVYEDWRRQGIGRWLLRHAIGIAESRGGRTVEAACPAPAAFWRDSGFHCEDGTFRLRLTPE